MQTKHLIYILPCLLAVTLMIGCGASNAKIDASSDETLKDSIAAAKDNLTPEQRKEFEEALKILAFSDVGNLFELAADPDSIQRQLEDKIDGKSPLEIIEAAKQVKTERAKKQREHAAGEIAELKKKIQELNVKQQAAQTAENDLKNFTIERSRFYFDKQGFSTGPIIELTVKNNTAHPVSRAYFKGVLGTPGRAVPWVEETFNYSISGGIEPGESDTWKLSPNMFGKWGSAPKDRDDMVLTVTTYRIDGADDKPIFDSEFSEYDQKELKRLNERIVSLESNLDAEIGK